MGFTRLFDLPAESSRQRQVLGLALDNGPIEPVSATRPSLFPGNGIWRPEKTVPETALRLHWPSPETAPRAKGRQHGALLHAPRNLSFRKNVWWPGRTRTSKQTVMSGAFSFAASSATKIPELDSLLKEARFGLQYSLSANGPYQLSKIIIQKSLASVRHQSGTVASSHALRAFGILPRRPDGRGGASVVRQDAAVNRTEDSNDFYCEDKVASFGRFHSGRKGGAKSC
jgi:hypothetical protein